MRVHVLGARAAVLIVGRRLSADRRDGGLDGVDGVAHAAEAEERRGRRRRHEERQRGARRPRARGPPTRSAMSRSRSAPGWGRSARSAVSSAENPRRAVGTTSSWCLPLGRYACNGKHRSVRPGSLHPAGGEFATGSATIRLVTAVSWKMIEHGWSVRSRRRGRRRGLPRRRATRTRTSSTASRSPTTAGFAVHNYADRPHYVEASQVGAIETPARSADDHGRGGPQPAGARPAASAEIVPEDASLLDRLRTGIEHLTGEDHTN